jgi:hypothetical protein
MADAIPRAPTWKRVLAPILDSLTAFFGFGMAIAYVTGDTTPGGFNLNGWPALVLFALIVAYFFLGRLYAGGTLWDRVLGIGRPQPRA